MQKKLKINKQNFQGEVYSGFIMKLIKITQENIKLGRQQQQQKQGSKNVYRQIPNQFLWHKI